jgi:predicted DNA binding protein
MKMTKQIAEKIIQDVRTDLETLSDFCHYNKMDEEITFMENATAIFKKHVDLTEEEEMAIRVAISIGYTKLSDDISILQEQLNDLEAQMPCY